MNFEFTMNYETECERALSAAEAAVAMDERDDAMWHCGRAEAFRKVMNAMGKQSPDPLVQRLIEVERWLNMTEK